MTVETAVRSRLRSARLYLGENYSAVLYVSVRTAGYAVALHLRFYKFVNEIKQYYPDRRVYPGGWAITCFNLWVGQYGGDSAYIMDGVLQADGSIYRRISARERRRVPAPMKRRLGPKHAPVLRAFAKAYRVQAEVETDPDEMRALIRLAKKAEREAKEMERVGPTRHLRDAENAPTLNDRLRGKAAAADVMLHIVLECLGSDFIGRDRVAYDLMSARDDAKVSAILPSEAARKGYADKLQEPLSRILDR